MKVRHILASLAALAAAAQQPPPGEVVIRSTTRLVEVGAVAQDHAGHYVADLRREDFTIFDNGKPQTVAVFAVNAPSTAPLPSAAPGTFSNRVGPRGGYTVILLDWLNTGFGDRAQAREQVIRMLRRIDAADRIAIYVLDRGLRAVHEFGGDTAALLGRLSAASGAAAGPVGEDSPFAASRREIATDLFGSAQPHPAAGGSRLTMEEQIHHLDLRIRDTLAALEAIGRHLEGVEGRKSLIWVTAGIPTSIDGAVVRGAAPGERTYTQEIDKAIRRLNNADVAVYAIDARGLSISPNAYINIQTMQQFAARTGGVAYANRNDLDNELRAALDDQRISYTLGFYAPDTAPDAPHRIRVRVERKGITLRYRDAYYAVSPPPKPADILRSPVDATAIPVSVKAARRGVALDVTLMLEAGSLNWHVEQGRRGGRIEIVPVFLAADGSFLEDPKVREMAMDLLPATYETALRDGLRFPLTLPVPANAARLRILVRDMGSGAIGTLTFNLSQVP